MPPPLDELLAPPAPPAPPVDELLAVLELVPPRLQSGALLLSRFDGQQMSALPPRSRELQQTKPCSQSSLPLSMLHR
jgi:hypothetical protein